MFSPHSKFEVSTIACKEEMKSTPNVKNLVLSHPLGDLWVTYTVNLWLDGKRIVDFLLAIIERFYVRSHGCGTIKRNKMVKTGQFTTKCKGNKVIGLKQQISFC